MTIPPIDPSIALAEWHVPGVAGPGVAEPSAPSGGESFGDLLARQVGNLTELQAGAAEASQALATGTATDPSEAVVAVSKAELAMQLAGQVRTRASEAFQDVFRTQV